jgi:hypothetical protein
MLRAIRIIAAGNSGIGKSHIGLGLAACQKGLSVGFTPGALLRLLAYPQAFQGRGELRLIAGAKRAVRLTFEHAPEYNIGELVAKRRHVGATPVSPHGGIGCAT